MCAAFFPLCSDAKLLPRRTAEQVVQSDKTAFLLLFVRSVLNEILRHLYNLDTSAADAIHQVFEIQPQFRVIVPYFKAFP